MRRTALSIWFVAVAVLLTANTVVCYINVRKLVTIVEYVTQARETLFELDRVVLAMRQAESAERGYIITGAAGYRAEFDRSAARVRERLPRFRALAREEHRRSGRVDRLVTLAEQELAFLTGAIELRDAQGFEAARDRVASNHSQEVTAEAQRLAAEVREIESEVLAERSRERDRAKATAIATLAGGGVVNLLLLGMLAWAVRHDAVARARGAAQRERQLELERDNAALGAEVQERQRSAEAQAVLNRELSALNERLERSNRELQDFAYVASHDLQEPLRKIQAFGDRLRAKFAEPLGEQGKDYVERMHNAASRMQRLINDLLSFARVTTKAQPFAPTDLGQVAREVLEDLEGRIESSGGTVEVGPLPTIDADALQMRQVLQNLLSNALKFRKKDVPPVVRVTARVLESPGAAPEDVAAEEPGAGPGGHKARAGAGGNGSPAGADADSGAQSAGADQAGAGPIVEIRVADNGVGFDEKYLDRIFSVFQRLHGRQEYEGTGIGLAVCRKIAERHGGAVTAVSREGEGSTFILRLPVHHPDPTAPAAPAVTASAPAAPAPAAAGSAPADPAPAATDSAVPASNRVPGAADAAAPESSPERDPRHVANA